MKVHLWNHPNHITDDLGVMALRSCADLANVLKCVLGFDDRTSYAAMGSSAKLVVERGENRRSGKRKNSARVFSLPLDGHDEYAAAFKMLKEEVLPFELPIVPPTAREVGECASEPDALKFRDDGFIAL